MMGPAVLILFVILILTWIGSNSKKDEKLSCLSGSADVNGTCLIRLIKSKDKYVGGGLVVKKHLTGWSKNRWILSGDTGMGLLYSNTGATTPGDITYWRTTNNYITKGDKDVLGFHLVKHGSDYYLPNNYRELLVRGRLMHRK